jgi:peptidoglycan/xylan/chitin deacetylase (PgdA/CDA1 family)
MVLPYGKREILAQALDRSGCNRLLRLAGTWNGLLVLNYHRIGKPNGSLLDWDLWSADEETFDQQVRYLARNFDLIGLDDLQQVLQRPLESTINRFVMITFDDGYRDNFELAYPILRSHNATAAFFVTTGFIDRPMVPWWDEIAWMVRSSVKHGIDANIWTIQPLEFDDPDRQAAIKSLLQIYKNLDGRETRRYLDFLAVATGSGRCPSELADELWMTWDMLREMQAGGMCFGTHTVNHPVLSSLSAEGQSMELCESRLRLETELGREITAMSYPIGSRQSFNRETRNSLIRHSYRWAFSYYGGFCRPDNYDALDLPRVAVETDVSIPAFHSVATLPQVFA